MAKWTPNPAAAAARAGALGHEPTTLSLRGGNAAPARSPSLPGTRLSRVCPSCHGRYPTDFRVCPRDATELEDEAELEELDPLLGAVVGETFSLVRVIGEGGMARVYEARHVRLPNKRFAVKVLHHMYAQQPAIVTRFEREADAVSGIHHPNVVDVYDIGQTPDGRPYLVSEFLEGMDFSTLLEQRGKIPPPAAVHVVRQVCRALAAAHAQGVVHRDVKPENVFLIGDLDAPVVKVLDFGISKMDGQTGASLTQTGMIMGTPGYMPPEQARGSKTDHRADIYGVGAMLYRAVTGRPPFDSDDASEALSMVLTDEPPRPRAVAPSLPEALELVIQKAMAKDPDDRYRSMNDLDAQLAPFDPEPIASVSLLPPPPGSPQRTGPKPRVATVAPSILDVESRGREARRARPAIIFTTFAIYLWLLACFVDVAGTALSAMRGGTATTPTEKLMTGTTLAAVSLTPLVFWLRHLGTVWSNTVRAVALSRLLRRVVLTATVPYAFLALALRVLSPLTDLRWAPLLAPVSVLMGAIAYGLNRAEQRKRRSG